MVNYYALHYHMKHAGVRFTLDNIFNSLSDMNLFLIYSDQDEIYEKRGVQTLPIQTIDYDDQTFISRVELDKHAEQIKDSIKSKLDLTHQCVLHTHNVNLMKNTCLGRAIQFLSDELPELLIILQVHDFAEDHRIDELKLMMHATGKYDSEFASRLAYPIGNNIVYCTINSRDMDLLSKIGIPKDRLFVLPNSVNIKFLESEPISGFKQKLAEYACDHGYSFDPNKRILLAPMRIMRRKNIVESILILNLLNEANNQWQLLINLDANGKEDIICSEAIKTYVMNNNLPVVVGFGYELVSPNKQRSEKFPHNMVDVFAVADYVLTTSKIEGFGFVFIECWLQDRALIGRKIDFLNTDFANYGLDLSHLYNEIIIEGKDFKDYDYTKQLKLLDSIDYSKLQMQNFKDFVEQDHTELIKNNKQAVKDNYSLEAYNKRLTNMIKNGFEHINDKDIYKIDNSFLIEYFENDKSSYI